MAFILDVYARVIVGWQIATHMRTDLPVNSLTQLDGLPIDTFCVEVLLPPVEPSQYTSIRYTDRLAHAGLAASIGTIGDPYDINAMAEALNGTFKAELIKLHGPWRTRHQLEIAIIEWIDWYNHRHLHSEIGNIPPAEYETQWYHQHDLAETAGKH